MLSFEVIKNINFAEALEVWTEVYGLLWPVSFEGRLGGLCPWNIMPSTFADNVCISRIEVLWTGWVATNNNYVYSELLLITSWIVWTASRETGSLNTVNPQLWLISFYRYIGTKSESETIKMESTSMALSGGGGYSFAPWWTFVNIWSDCRCHSRG